MAVVAWERGVPSGGGLFWFYGAKSPGAAERLVLVRVVDGRCYSLRANSFLAHVDQMCGWWQPLAVPAPPDGPRQEVAR